MVRTAGVMCPNYFFSTQRQADTQGRCEYGLKERKAKRRAARYTQTKIELQMTENGHCNERDRSNVMHDWMK